MIFSAHPVKLTVLVTAFLRILYPLGGVTAYLGKMCFIALEGTQQISLWLIALIFLSAGFVLPMIAPCFCLVFHAQFRYQTHLILPTKQAVFNLCAHADMANKRRNLLVHQPLLYLIVQCFGSNLLLLCVMFFSVPSITVTTCVLTPRGRVRASAFFQKELIDGLEEYSRVMLVPYSAWEMQSK